jgi:hypothetical protein
MKVEQKLLRGVEVKSEAEGLVSAVFSTFNVVDRDGDVVLPGAFKSGAPVRISAYGHGSWNGMLPVGKGNITTNDREAVLTGRFFMDTQAGRETFTVVKELGELGEWSYSLENVVAKEGLWQGRKARIISRVDVHEVSPVLKGASIGTRTLATKDATRAEMTAIRDSLFGEEGGARRELEREYLKMVKTSSLVLYRGEAVQTQDDHREPIPEGRIPERIRGLAKAAAKLAADHLGIEAPQVFWYEDRTGQTLGYAYQGYGGEIWIRHDLRGRELLRVAAHEVSHCKGYGEPEAQTYERTFIEEVLV